MKKGIFELRNWYLKQAGEQFYAEGNVFFNPKFSAGRHIHTSAIQEVIRYMDAWLIVTRNSEYAILDETELNGTLQEESHRFLAGLKTEEKKERLKEILQPKWDALAAEKQDTPEKSALLSFSTEADYYITAAVIKDGTTSLSVHPHVHVGTFQDSVLLRSGFDDPLEFDFRYYSYGGGRVEFYAWDHEYRVMVRNEGPAPLEVDTSYGDFLIPPEVTIVPAEEKLYRITEHIAPSIDKHNVWEAKVLDDGVIAYSSPKTGGDEEEDQSDASGQEKA